MYTFLCFNLELLLFLFWIVALSWRFGYFGQGTGLPLLMDNVGCSGLQLKLTSCPYAYPSGNDNHAEDSGVTCYSNSDLGIECVRCHFGHFFTVNHYAGV